MNASATIAPAKSEQAGSGAGGREAQYMQALARANEVRIARARVKRRIAEGLLTVAEVVTNCPAEARSMALCDLLVSQRRWGQTRARKVLAQAGLSERKAVGSLTDRQRRVLLELLNADGGEQIA